MVYVIIVGAAVIFWLVFVDRPICTMSFKSGQLGKHSGRLPQSFLHNCKEIAHKSPFDGVIKVYSTRSGTKFVFTKGVPNKVRQQVRNVFPHQGIKSSGKRA